MSRIATTALILLATSLVACSQDQTSEGKGPPPDTELSYDGMHVDSLKGETILDSTRVEQPADLAISGGRLFVLETNPSPALRSVRLGTWDDEWTAGNSGEGPGEVKVPVVLAVAPNGDPWVYDMDVRRMTRYVRAVPGGFQPETTMTQLQFGTPLFRMVWLDDSTLIATGFFNETRLGLINADGRLRSEVGAPPPGDKTIAVPFRNMLYEGAVAAHPSHTKFVVSSKHAGRITIVDAATFAETPAKVPFEFEPAYTMDNTGQYRGMGMGSSDLRFGYIDVAATGTRIFALFSGRTRLMHPGDAYTGDYVHEFDWEGKLQRVLHLDARALGIAVDADGTELFITVESPQPSVLRYAIPPSD